MGTPRGYFPYLEGNCEEQLFLTLQMHLPAQSPSLSWGQWWRWGWGGASGKEAAGLDMGPSSPRCTSRLFHLGIRLWIPMGNRPTMPSL